jgi:hypothetical protein
MATTVTQRVTGNPSASISNRIPHRLLLSGDAQAGTDRLLLSGDTADGAPGSGPGQAVELLSGDAIVGGIASTITQRI